MEDWYDVPVVPQHVRAAVRAVISEEMSLADAEVSVGDDAMELREHVWQEVVASPSWIGVQR